MNIKGVALSWARPPHSPRSSVFAKPWPPSIRSSGRRCRPRTGGWSSPAPIDAVLGGGLACGALHELAPAAPFHLGAASGFAVAVAARASAQGGASRGEVLWITTDFARGEGGGPYGPGLDRFGLSSSRLLVLTVSRPADVLWAMEEGLRCRALACVIAELTGEGAEADLTATRRLSLAARDGVSARISGLGLLIRHRATLDAERRGDPLAASPAARACPTGWRDRAAASAARASTFRFARTGAARPAAGSSSGTIMSVLSSRRYLSVWLRRLSTDRIERRLSAPDDAPRVVVATIEQAQRIVAMNDAAARLRLQAPACRSPTRAPCIRRCRCSRPISRPTAACSKPSPTGATATRRWSGSIRRTACSSTSPAARICSAAKRRSPAIS